MQANMFEDRFIVQEMARVYKDIIPWYPADKERDFRALRSISTFLSEQIQIHGQGGIQIMDGVLAIWRKVADYIKTDKFYCQKSLSTISNHIQELTIKAAYGDKSSKGGKLSTDSLADKINKRFGKG